MLRFILALSLHLAFFIANKRLALRPELTLIIPKSLFTNPLIHAVNVELLDVGVTGLRAKLCGRHLVAF